MADVVAVVVPVLIAIEFGALSSGGGGPSSACMLDGMSCSYDPPILAFSGLIGEAEIAIAIHLGMI